MQHLPFAIPLEKYKYIVMHFSNICTFCIYLHIAKIVIVAVQNWISNS